MQEPTNPVAIVGAAARLTQKGHMIHSVEDFAELMSKPNKGIVKAVQNMEHFSVTRHAHWTLLIVGGSRRLLAQLRTHHVGIDWTSASMQYGNYNDVELENRFVVPYEVLERGPEAVKIWNEYCANNAEQYSEVQRICKVGHDSAGYIANQASRNLLLVTGNTQAWHNLIRERACCRNTEETQYVTMLIWKRLMESCPVLFCKAGPQCLQPGGCRQGKMSCGTPVHFGKTGYYNEPVSVVGIYDYIKAKWPLLGGDK